jgi:hypothetical protein
MRGIVLVKIGGTHVLDSEQLIWIDSLRAIVIERAGRQHHEKYWCVWTSLRAYFVNETRPLRPHAGLDRSIGNQPGYAAYNNSRFTLIDGRAGRQH